MATFYIMMKIGKDGEWAVHSEHATPREAAEAAKNYNAYAKSCNDPRRFRVMAATDTAEGKSWRAREQGRFDSGTYLSVPWAEEDWFKKSAHYDTHFAHLSAADTKMVAYTRGEQEGIRDRQTRVRPGRYLTQYFGEEDGGPLSDEQIAEWCAKMGCQHEENTIKFAYTADEIEHVYVHGPSSCMSYAVDEYSSKVHPTRVYAGPDLAVAYLERDGEITARCVCWPGKKIYTRLYGDECRLGHLLKKAGYIEGSLVGAKMSRIVQHSHGRDCYVMPYLDYIDSCRDDGKHLVIGQGDIFCKETNGLSVSLPCCDNCGERSGELYTVDGDSQWCLSCFENDATCCGSCGNYFTETTEVAGDYVCDLCLSRHYRQCDHCEAYFAPCDIEPDINGANTCESCAENMERSPGCERPVPADDKCGCDECRQSELDLAS